MSSLGVRPGWHWTGNAAAKEKREPIVRFIRIGRIAENCACGEESTKTDDTVDAEDGSILDTESSTDSSQGSLISFGVAFDEGPESDAYWLALREKYRQYFALYQMDHLKGRPHFEDNVKRTSENEILSGLVKAATETYRREPCGRPCAQPKRTPSMRVPLPRLHEPPPTLPLPFLAVELDFTESWLFKIKATRYPCTPFVDRVIELSDRWFDMIMKETLERKR